jgi:hypothetical protein
VPGKKSPIATIESMHMKERCRNIIIVGEDLNFIWSEDDIKEAEAMYKAGIPFHLIADNFGRPDIEVAIMIMWRGERGHIKASDYGSKKRRLMG